MLASRHPAFDDLYEELREHAYVLMQRTPAGHTLQPTALISEAYLRLRHRYDIDRGEFMKLASTVMRRILIDYARKKSTVQRAPMGRRVPLLQVDDDVSQTLPPNWRELQSLDSALTQLEEFRPEWAEIVQLKYFGGHTISEIAELTGRTRRTVERWWALARTWLALRVKEIQSHDF